MWFIYPENVETNNVIETLKRQVGKNDEDYRPDMLVRSKGNKKERLGLWLVSFEDIRRIMTAKSVKGLRFKIYRETSSGSISNWEYPTKKKDRIKIVLPLISMVDNDGKLKPENLELIREISRDKSSAKVSYVPVYDTLSRMKRDDDDREQVDRGFETLMELILRGAFNEIHLFGDRITPGMERIIIFGEAAGVPVIPRSKGTLKELKDLLE